MINFIRKSGSSMIPWRWSTADQDAKPLSFGRIEEVDMDPNAKEESEQMEVVTPSDRGFLSDDEPAVEQPDDEAAEPEED